MASLPKLSRRKTRGAPPARGAVPLIALLLLWQLLGSSSSAYYPRPSSWWAGLSALWDNGTLAPAMRETAWAFLLSLVVATFLGCVLGILIGRLRVVYRALNPTFEFLRAMPSAALVPVFSLLIGYSIGMKVTVVVITAVWPVLLNVSGAVHRVNVTLREVSVTLQLGRLATLRKVTVPSIIPSIILGVRVAAPIALVVTLLVEIITSTSGLGALIAQSQRNFQAPALFGLVAIASLFGVFVNLVVAAAERVEARYRVFSS